MSAWKVYKKIVPLDFDYSNQEKLYAKMPQNIKAVLGHRNSLKRMMSLLGWELLAHNVSDKDVLSKVKFKKKGKPFIPNSNLFFNISNTKGIVVLVISDIPVGIDVERLRTPRENVYSKVFSKEEIHAISNSLDFTRLWTRKEAVVKLFGGGISMGLKSFSVLEDKFEAFGKKVKVEQLFIDDFIAHIAIYI